MKSDKMLNKVSGFLSKCVYYSYEDPPRMVFIPTKRFMRKVINVVALLPEVPTKELISMLGL